MSPRAIDMALDLARMPALAQSSARPPVPPDVLEVMRIAAGSAQACGAASAATGVPVHALIEAARFYLQQILFRPEADCYRILGLQPGASRELARSHMRCLMQWLHPDRNGGLDAIYAERVLKAWREVSTPAGVSFANVHDSGHTYPDRDKRKTRKRSASPRLPWIERPLESPRLGKRRSYLRVAGWGVAVAVSLAVGLFLLRLVVPVLDVSQAITSAISADDANGRQSPK